MGNKDKECPVKECPDKGSPVKDFPADQDKGPTKVRDLLRSQTLVTSTD